MKELLSIVAFLLTAFLTHAQEPKFSVEISNDTLLVGNYFELKYTIENVSPNNFEPPKLQIHHIVGGPNSSTQMSLVNGEMSQSASYSYYIEPSEIGSYTIPPAFLTTDDGSLETPPVDILVLPNPEGIVQKPHQAGKKYDQINTPAQVEEEPKRPIKKF